MQKTELEKRRDFLMKMSKDKQISLHLRALSKEERKEFIAQKMQQCIAVSIEKNSKKNHHISHESQPASCDIEPNTLKSKHINTASQKWELALREKCVTKMSNESQYKQQNESRNTKEPDAFTNIKPIRTAVDNGSVSTPLHQMEHSAHIDSAITNHEDETDGTVTYTQTTHTIPCKITSEKWSVEVDNGCGDERTTPNNTGRPTSYLEIQPQSETETYTNPPKMFLLQILAICIGGFILFLSISYLISFRLEPKLDDYFCESITLEDIRHHSINDGLQYGSYDACYDTSESVINNTILWSTDVNGYKTVSLSADARVIFESIVLIVISVAVSIFILYSIIRMSLGIIGGTKCNWFIMNTLQCNRFRQQNRNWITVKVVFYIIIILLQSQAINGAPSSAPSLSPSPHPTSNPSPGFDHEVIFDCTTLNGWINMSDVAPRNDTWMVVSHPLCGAPTPCIRIRAIYNNVINDVWIQRDISIASGWINTILVYDIATYSFDKADYVWIATKCSERNVTRYNFPKNDGNFSDFVPIEPECDVLTIKVGAAMKASGTGIDLMFLRNLKLQYSTAEPTTDPTSAPSVTPTEPTVQPTLNPSDTPTIAPSRNPSNNPTTEPTTNPSSSPSFNPTLAPTNNPSTNPTKSPSFHPSLATTNPSSNPSMTPSESPSQSTSAPTTYPSLEPTSAPTTEPTVNPSKNPTKSPTTNPSVNPSKYPTDSPSKQPSANPSKNPTEITEIPSRDPTTEPTVEPTMTPSNTPSSAPTTNPSLTPSMTPTLRPSESPLAEGDPTRAPSKSTIAPTNYPSLEPTNGPTTEPTINPSENPTESPTVEPTSNPSVSPSKLPSSSPSSVPSLSPSSRPTSNPTTGFEVIFDCASLEGWTKMSDRSPEQDTWSVVDSEYCGASTTCIRIQSIPNGKFTDIWIQRNISTEGWINKILVYDVTTFAFDATDQLWIATKCDDTIETRYDAAAGDTDYFGSLPIEQECNLLTIKVGALMKATGAYDWVFVQNLKLQYATAEPTASPTSVPSVTPTSNPSSSPTIEPTLQPTLNPTVEPTIYPTTNPSSSPSSNPSSSPSFNPTLAPTKNPSTNPTKSPSFHPSLAPTRNPTINPSVPPSNTPSTAPTSNPSSNPSLTPSESPTNDPSAHPSAAPSLTPSANPSIDPTDSPSSDPTLLPTNDPTTEPSVEPTMFPTKVPTSDPSVFPTLSPTTSHPTEANQPVFNVSFASDATPFSLNTFMGDPYGRFQASIDIMVFDEENYLKVTALCTTCFVWQFRLKNGVWTDIEYLDDDDISVYNKVVTQSAIITYESALTIQSIRRLYAGRCFDEIAAVNARIFQPGNRYEIRLKFDTNHTSKVSNALLIETNTLPFGGRCMVQNIENVATLQEYNLYCDGWENDDDLEYNAMISNVLISKSSFVNNAIKLQSIAPSAGNVSIIVLIKQKNISSAITCYPINAVFKSSFNASNIDALLEDVSSLTNSTSFSENPVVAIAIHSVIDELFALNLTSKHEAAQLLGNIVGNIIDGAGLTSSADIISGLSTLSALTTNAQIISLDTTSDLVYGFISGVFDAVDDFADGYDGDIAIQDIYYTIAEASQDLIDNLEHTLQAERGSFGSNISNETVDDEVIGSMNHLAQSLVEFATMGASKALLQSNVGESFNYDKITYDADGSIASTKSIIATKFDANIIDYNDSSLNADDIQLPKCGKKNQNIQLPLSFMQQQDGEFDCALVASSMNNFITTKKRAQKSDTVSIDLFAGKKGNRRRRLIEFESNECYPYLISMTLNDPSLNYNSYENVSLGEELEFPSCDFWHTSSTFWDTSGCFVYGLLDTSVTCGCTHLTTFSLSDGSIIPNANIKSMIEWKHFTIGNLIKYPTVWLTCFIILSLFLVICYFNPYSERVHSRSILAFEDIIYKSYQDRILYQDTVGKEIKYISDYMPNKHFVGMGIRMIASDKTAQKYICVLQWKLFLAYLGNEHTFLSVFQRSAGTGFSVRQRLGCFFMYLANIMMVTGTFYGLEQSSPAQDIAASFIISLSGTIPVTIVKNFFLKSKPRVVESTRHYFADVEDKKTVKKNTKNLTVIYGSLKWKDFDMANFLKEAKKKHMSMKDFTKELGKYYDVNNKHHRIRAMSEIRKILFNKTFPWRYEWKKVGWVSLVLWSSAACAMAIMYGLSFDIHAVADEDELYQNNCWNTTLSLQIEDKLSREKFMNDYAEQQEHNASSYGGSDSMSWLLTIFSSLFQSMLLWQPLTAYVTTWIKVWLFTWHLKMELGPKTMLRLCKNCCRTKAVNDDGADSYLKTHHSLQVDSLSSRPKSSYQPSSLVSHEDRPFDMISFLGSATWIIDDVEEEDYNIYGDDEGAEIELQTTAKEEEKANTNELIVEKSVDETATATQNARNSLIFALVDTLMEGRDGTEDEATILQTATEEQIIVDTSVDETTSTVHNTHDSLIFDLVDTLMDDQDEKEDEATLNVDINLDDLVDDIILKEENEETDDAEEEAVGHIADESIMDNIDMFVDAVFSENELQVSDDDDDHQES